MRDPNCIFCKIMAGEIPAFKVWEDAAHIAILSRHPNTEGFTVVITKEHYPSYFAELPQDARHALADAAAAVAKLLDSKFEDVGRTGMIFEGYGVNHMHAKLFPMHGTAKEGWEQHVSSVDTYFDRYEGYIASNDSKPQGEEALAATAKKITG